MNLTRLRVFAAVAESGTFAAAADRLHFTPSAVSQHMARFEAELGAALVRRSSRGIELTEAGHVLQRRAPPILADLDDAAAAVAAAGGAAAPALALGSFPAATRTLAAAAVRALRARHPEIEVEIRDGAGAEHRAALGAGALDLALLSAEPGDPVEGETLGVDRLLAVLPACHPLAAAETLSRAALSGTRALPYRGADPESVRALVAAGEGVALVPALAAPAPGAGVVLRALHPREPGPRVMLARRPSGAGSPAAERLAALLRREARRRWLTPEAATGPRDRLLVSRPAAPGSAGGGARTGAAAGVAGA